MFDLVSFFFFNPSWCLVEALERGNEWVGLMEEI